MADEKGKQDVENQFEDDQKSTEAIMRPTTMAASKLLVEEYQKNEKPNNYHLSDYQHNTHLEKSRTGSYLHITDTQDILNEITDSNKVQTVDDVCEYVKKELVLRKILKKSDLYGWGGLRILEEPFVRLEPYIAAPATLTLYNQFGEAWMMELVENKRGRFLRKGWKKYAARHRLKIGDTIIIQRTLVMKQVLDISPKSASSSSAELAKSEVLRTKYDIIIEREQRAI